MSSKSRVTILVKALPQPSRKHSETVCCAGLDSFGHWKRLFPIRFRQLGEGQVFKRWNVVEFEYSKPTSDNRIESCRVHEESIAVAEYIGNSEKRSNLVNPAIIASEEEAISLGRSLTAIRPTDVDFSWKRRTVDEIDKLRDEYERQARQYLMFDKELDVLEPCPFKFTMHFKDGDGKQRNKTCADWETSAAFFNLSQTYAENEVLQHLKNTYCDDYVKRGLVLALGNLAKRPQTWQLLGIFPVSPTNQTALDL